jgi:hypothetical protein
MRGAIPPLLNKLSWRGAQLKHRNNFTFYSLPFTPTCSAGLSALLCLAGNCLGSGKRLNDRWQCHLSFGRQLRGRSVELH